VQLKPGLTLLIIQNQELHQVQVGQQRLNLQQRAPVLIQGLVQRAEQVAAHTVDQVLQGEVQVLIAGRAAVQVAAALIADPADQVVVALIADQVVAAQVVAQAGAATRVVVQAEAAQAVLVERQEVVQAAHEAVLLLHADNIQIVFPGRLLPGINHSIIQL
jgi:hypothetical protein